MITENRLELPETKRCGVCGLTKHVEDFSRRADRPCGRKHLCLVCDRVKARRYYDGRKHQ